MLFSHRRRALMHLCLVGMDVLWFGPLFMVLWVFPARLPFWSALGWLLAGLLGWTLALEALNRLRARAPWYQLAVLALVILSSLLLVRQVVYPDVSWKEWAWLRELAEALIGWLYLGVRPGLVLVLTNLFLWQRAAWATSRQLSLWEVGAAFRIELALLVAGAALYASSVGQYPPLLVVWLYWGVGMLALALARSDETAFGGTDAGWKIPWTRLAQLVGLIGLTVLFAAWLFKVLPAPLLTVLGALRPLGELAIILFQVVFVFAWLLLAEIGRWLTSLTRGEFPNLVQSLDALVAMLHQLAQWLADNLDFLPPIPLWLVNLLCALPFVLMLGLALGSVFIFLRLLRPPRDEREQGRAAPERLFVKADVWSRGWQSLREWARLVRRYGLSRQLLDAISVQNIYANVCRLAWRRGYPRPYSLPPDRYVPLLVEAFGGFDEPLARITEAYMRVHYGEKPVSPAELAAIQADYRAVRCAVALSEER